MHYGFDKKSCAPEKCQYNISRNARHVFLVKSLGWRSKFTHLTSFPLFFQVVEPMDVCAVDFFTTKMMKTTNLHADVVVWLLIGLPKAISKMMRKIRALLSPLKIWRIPEDEQFVSMSLKLVHALNVSIGSRISCVPMSILEAKVFTSNYYFLIQLGVLLKLIILRHFLSKTLKDYSTLKLNFRSNSF